LSASVFLPTGAIWVTRPQWLISGGTLWAAEGPITARCVPCLMPWERSVDIDTEQDLAWAKYVVARNQKLAVLAF